MMAERISLKTERLRKTGSIVPPQPNLSSSSDSDSSSVSSDTSSSSVDSHDSMEIDEYFKKKSMVADFLPDYCNFVHMTTIETKYFAILPFYISEPRSCKEWNYQFGGLESKIEGISLEDRIMEAHYDLIPVLLSFKNRYNNGGRLWMELHKREDLIYRDEDLIYKDRYVKICDDVTLCLRQISFHEVKMRKERADEEVLTNLPLVPHQRGDTNIYEDVKDPKILWILHLILYQQSRDPFFKKIEIDLIMKEERYSINLFNIYQTLFLSFMFV